MGARYQAIRGTYDILPGEAGLWQQVEATARKVFGRFHFSEIRTPAFESTELFTRSIGQSTDIVSKEMYTFLDKKDRSLTLRPEATACVVRAYLEHPEAFRSPVQKLYYIGPMFRYEKPQSGRSRQFHQIGVELLGSHKAGADAEVIALLCVLLEEFGLTGVKTKIGTVGCPACRPGYAKKLQGFLSSRLEGLCADCKKRCEKNPLRVFDCKNQDCKQVLKDAPLLTDSACEGCSTHLQEVQSLLKEMGVGFCVDPRLVRGIDYYTKTTFELSHDALGAQDAVAAGGRYDNLVQELGGASTGAVGFALGVERVILALKAKKDSGLAMPDAFLVSLGEGAHRANIALAMSLRKAGLAVDMDHEGRSMKAQMRQADKSGARFALIRGEKELAEGKLQVRDMKEGKDQTLSSKEAQKWLLQTLKT